MLSEALVCSLTEGFGAGALSFEAEEVDGSAARASDFFTMASCFLHLASIDLILVLSSE